MTWYLLPPHGPIVVLVLTIVALAAAQPDFNLFDNQRRGPPYELEPAQSFDQSAVVEQKQDALVDDTQPKSAEPETRDQPFQFQRNDGPGGIFPRSPLSRFFSNVFPLNVQEEPKEAEVAENPRALEEEAKPENPSMNAIADGVKSLQQVSGLFPSLFSGLSGVQPEEQQQERPSLHRALLKGLLSRIGSMIQHKSSVETEPSEVDDSEQSKPVKVVIENDEHLKLKPFLPSLVYKVLNPSAEVQSTTDLPESKESHESNNKLTSSESNSLVNRIVDRIKGLFNKSKFVSLQTQEESVSSTVAPAETTPTSGKPNPFWRFYYFIVRRKQNQDPVANVVEDQKIAPKWVKSPAAFEQKKQTGAPNSANSPMSNQIAYLICSLAVIVASLQQFYF